MALSLFVFLIIFFPIISKEVSYFLNKPSKDIEVSIGSSTSDYGNEKSVMIAANPEFSIVIPKIGANSNVVANVDPYDSRIYQQALSKGVAHASGTSLPGQMGNSFYFAHSSDNFYNANRFNSVFYLLNKMQNEDEFFLVYNSEIFRYKVIETNIVAPEKVSYMATTNNKKLATLMTCWPAGTTLNRLVVVGELIEE